MRLAIILSSVALLMKTRNAPMNLFSHILARSFPSVSVLQGQKIIDTPFCAFCIISNHIGNGMLVKLEYSKVYQFTFDFTDASNRLPEFTSLHNILNIVCTP